MTTIFTSNPAALVRRRPGAVLRPNRAPLNPVLCDFVFEGDLRPGVGLATRAERYLDKLRTWQGTPAYKRARMAPRQRVNGTDEHVEHAIRVLERIVSLSLIGAGRG